MYDRQNLSYYSGAEMAPKWSHVHVHRMAGCRGNWPYGCGIRGLHVSYGKKLLLPISTCILNYNGRKPHLKYP